MSDLGPIRSRATRLFHKPEQKRETSTVRRELIALAVAVTTRCGGCITVHSKAALKEGATVEEIAEALGVAVALNAVAALAYSGRVLYAVASRQR